MQEDTKVALQGVSVFIVGSLIIAAFFSFLYCLVRPVAVGKKIGTIIHCADKGFIFKTHECEITKGGMNNGSGSFGSTVDFTIKNDDLNSLANNLLDEGKEVILTYHEERFCPLSSNEDHCRFADSIIPKE